jgi:outer membrane protein assembly factor BamE (lipoprotein component of BamABCDE complex)
MIFRRSYVIILMNCLISKGMNQDDVRKILGEPLTINSGSITYWYYSKSMVDGFVMFDDEEKVDGWKEPE